MPNRPRWLVPAAFITLGLIWGSSFAWIAVAVDEIPPATLVAWRMTLGAIGMVGLLPFLGQRLPRTVGALLPLAVMGAINAALPIFLISWAEQFVDSGTAGVLNSLVPIFSLVLAGVILRTEPVTMLRVTGVVIGFVGAAQLAGRQLELHSDTAGLLGALAVVLAAVSYAVGASYAKHRIKTTPRYVVAAGTLVFAAIYMWAVAIPVDGGVILPTQLDTILAVLWLGILGMFIAYVIFYFLIEAIGATLASMVTYVFPVVAVGLGVTLLDEPLDLLLIAGTALVVLGVVVVGLRYDLRLIRAPREARE